MMKFYCDRCEAEVDNDAYQRVDVIEEPDRDGDGTVNHQFDLCETCADALHEFMRDGTLSTKDVSDVADNRSLADVVAAAGLPPLE